MANNYITLTITPCLPKEAISEKMRGWFEEAGFTLQTTGEKFYIFADNNYPDLQDFEEAVLQEIAKEIGTEVVADMEELLQHILKHPACAEIECIEGEGATWCTKRRQGEFGGFCFLVTRQEILYENTYNILQNWKTQRGIKQ